MHTLNSIQNASGINRGQLAKVAEDLGIATGRGITISDEDRDRLVDEAKRRSEARLQALIQANTIKDSEAPTETAGQLQVITPTSKCLANPSMPSSVDLSLFGFESIDEFEDISLITAAANQVMDAIESQADAYLESLESKLTTTRAEAQKIKDRRSKFERKMDKAEILAKVAKTQLTEAQTAVSKEAKELAGKSSAAA